MNKEAYERLLMDVTEFDAEDVITTSGLEPTFGSIPTFSPTTKWEMPLGN